MPFVFKSSTLKILISSPRRTPFTKQKKTAAAGNKDAKTMVTVLEAYKAELEQGKNARGVTFETKEEPFVSFHT